MDRIQRPLDSAGLAFASRVVKGARLPHSYVGQPFVFGYASIDLSLHVSASGPLLRNAPISSANGEARLRTAKSGDEVRGDVRSYHAA